jgi:hypothetical protein
MQDIQDSFIRSRGCHTSPINIICLPFKVTITTAIHTQTGKERGITIFAALDTVIVVIIVSCHRSFCFGHILNDIISRTNRRMIMMVLHQECTVVGCHAITMM